MKKRAIVAGFIYSAIAIIFRLTILLGGYTLTDFAFYFSHITTVFLIIPFFFVAIQQVKNKDNGGLIGTKEAFRVALTVLAVGIVMVSAYNYLEFKMTDKKEIATEYYNSAQYLEILKKKQAEHPDKLKTEDFPMIISQQIEGLSALRDTTAKLFSMLILGSMGAFFAAVLMKKSNS